MARTLRSCVNQTDLVSRIEGDKFAVILHDQSPALTNRTAQAVETALHESFRAIRLELAFCIGAVCCTSLAAEFDQVLLEATTAMHQAYSAGGGVVFVNSEC